MEALKREKFDLVILGATLTRDDRHHLPYMAKKAHAGTRVLVLHTDGSRHPYVDGNIDTGEGIEKLIERIGGCTSRKRWRREDRFFVGNRSGSSEPLLFFAGSSEAGTAKSNQRPGPAAR